ncbi:MAG: hypothetical protein WCV55_03725 [Candidatus Paceibacterota bacterium]
MNFEQAGIDENSGAESVEPKIAPASLDDVLGELKSELSSVSEEAAQEVVADEEKEKIKLEKQRETIETIKPKLDQFMEMVNDQNIFDGKKTYFALKGNLEGYTGSEKEKRTQQFAINTLYEELANEYKEKTGGPLYISSIPMEFRDNKYNYTDGTYQRLNGKTEAEYMAGFDSFDREYPPAGLMRVDAQEAQTRLGKGSYGFNENSPVISNTPEDYVDNLARLQAYVTSKGYHFHDPELSDPSVVVSESTKRIYSHGFDTKAQGITLAAIESQDTTTAAKALAFAEKVQTMSPSTLQRLRSDLAALSSGKKQEFLSRFESEKLKLAA